MRGRLCGLRSTLCVGQTCSARAGAVLGPGPQGTHSLLRRGAKYCRQGAPTRSDRSQNVRGREHPVSPGGRALQGRNGRSWRRAVPERTTGAKTRGCNGGPDFTAGTLRRNVRQFRVAVRTPVAAEPWGNRRLSRGLLPYLQTRAHTSRLGVRPVCRGDTTD